MTTQDKAYNDYINGMKYKDIAQKYDVSINTVRSWKTRNKWNRKDARIKRTSNGKHKGAPFGSHNGKGGKPGNHNGVIHGIYAKYLPPETLELMDAAEKQSAIDALWHDICIQRAAIMRAQQIMYVKDDKDTTDRVIMDGVAGTTHQFTEAYEKQASFLIAQSRAMGTLTNMIKAYEELCRSGAADEEQKLRIEKLKQDLNVGAEDDGVQIIDDIEEGGKNHDADPIK